jgi:hypothetical protein
MIAPNDPFYYMGDESGATRPMVPAASENQVKQLLEVFENQISMPFAPTIGAHALVFGEWGHGKTQVLYRLRKVLNQHGDQCTTLMVIPEQLTPRFLVQAAAFEAETQGLPAQALHDAAHLLVEIDSQETRATDLAANAFVEFAVAAGRPHTVLLFDEAQTIEGVSFQTFLKILQRDFRERSIVLHTLQCHSLVSLDRALELARDLDWLQGPTVRKLILPAIREDEACELFRSRLESIAPARIDFIGDGVARTICNLTGGNPREMLKLAGALWTHAKGHDHATGDDLIQICERWESGSDGAALFMRAHLKRLTDLLPQVWQAPLGGKMATYLDRNIGHLFGENVKINVSSLADELGVNVALLETNLRRRVDNRKLLDETEDEIGTVFGLSVECRRYLSASPNHGGDFDEKQAQFDALMAPTLLQRVLSDALRLLELGEIGPPIKLGEYPDGLMIRGYELTYKVPDTNYQGKVLLASMPGVRWPISVGAELVKGLQECRWARVIILDLVVKHSWDEWQSECASAGINLPTNDAARDIVRIELNDWGDILPAPRESADLPGVRAAIFCGALLGAEHSRVNRISQSQTQKEARTGIIERVRERLPSAERYYYLPSDEERAWLDLPFWATGPVDLATLREQLSKPQFTSSQLRDLIPQYLEATSKKRWGRIPASLTPFAKVTIGVLQKQQDIERSKLLDIIRAKIVMPHPERLQRCLDWLLLKLQEERLVTLELTNVRFLDLSREARVRQREMRRLRRELETKLTELQSLSADHWLSVESRARQKLESSKVVLEQIHGPVGQNLIANLDETLEALRQHTDTIEEHRKIGQEKLDRLAKELTEWIAGRRTAIEKIHAAWRGPLGLDSALRELEQLGTQIARLAEGVDLGRDRLGRAEVIYQKARARNDQIEELLSEGPAVNEPRRKIVGAVLTRKFVKMTVSFTEGD